ncbi:MAG: endopeptidase La [Candidatus Eremiobacterota bacterium]
MTEDLKTLPILAVRNSVLFPHMVMPISAGRQRSVAAVEAALEGDHSLALFTQRDASLEEPGQDDLFSIGTRATIHKMSRGDSGYQLVLQGIERVRLVRVEGLDPFLNGRVQALPVPADEGPEVEALHRSVLEMAARLMSLVGQAPREGLIQQLATQLTDPMQLVYFVAGTMSLDTAREQQVLEAGTRREALELVYRFLVHELQVQEVRQRISSQVKSELGKEQQQYLLRQQLRAIQQELGELDGDEGELDLLREKLDQANLPEEVRKEADRELKRLERLNQASPDYSVTRTYLELVAELPWNRATEDSHDLQRARDILDQDHFGLKSVKERILEHLAVMKLNPQARAPILLFVGPPGVGKTSLGQSIARALDRKFERMSLGGLHDEAELRGHRRTYVGALPGRLIQAVRRAGARNPVLMLDEVDKIGMSYRGDPAAALLEIIDPAQNEKFRDNYLDLPFDLSRTLFIMTANTTDTIPRPLLDRMEVLRLTGYSEEEKMQIARRYLLPRQLSESGIRPEQLDLPDETLAYLVARYTREAGVRELERSLGRVTRKLALRFAEADGAEPVRVTVDDLAELLGPERYLPETARGELAPGVATGLAWTEAGGDVLYVESLLLPGGEGLTLTGQLGDVMKESARAAQSYILSRAPQFRISERHQRDSGVHVHVPAGAIPKDGPSAGVTMATSLLSAYTRTPVRKDVAMTGEITLTGLVLPVGGIKEKVLAARRAGIKTVVLPRENRKDLRELPEHVRDEMQFFPVERLDQVIEVAMPDLERRRAPAACDWN